jgi:glycosyltransferase involved in cell wall biosynthesis
MGGAERQALLLARYLRDEEHAEVRVFALGTEGPIGSLCDETRLQWDGLRLPPPGARVQQVRTLIGFARALRRARPDILLPSGRLPNRLCGALWRTTGARLCVWNHRAGAIDPVPRWVDRWAASRTPVFVANSQHGATYLEAAYGLPTAQVHVIRNGIELSRPRLTRAEWRKQLGVDERAFLACMVANLTRNKDHAALLRAWSKAVLPIAAGNRTPLLLLAGRSGDAYESIRDLAHSLRLGSSVRFLGHVDDIAGLLQAVDTGVFASAMEGSPNGVLECMAAGLPIIGTDVAGIREAVGPGGVPYLAPPHDDERFAELLVCLANDPERRDRIGQTNRRRVEEDFSPREMAARTATLCAAHLGGD